MGGIYLEFRPAGLMLEPIPVSQDGLAMAADLVLRDIAEPRARDRLHRGQDAAQEVRSARAQILVRGVDERLHGDAQGLLARHVALEALLERVARVLAPGPLGEVVRLLVAA